jgi:uncharacterized protein involved in type VI secretion and phage assembly
VLRQAGVAFRWDLTQTYPVRDYCVQYRETDYHFVKRLLAEEGIFFHFEPPSRVVEALVDGVAGATLGGIAGAALGAVASAAEVAGSLRLTETVVLSDSAERYPAIQGAVESALGTIVDAAVDAFAGPWHRGICSTSLTLF